MANFQDFIKEGERRSKKQNKHREPYTIQIEGEKDIKVEFPDANTWLLLQSVKEGDGLTQLQTLFRNNSRDLARLHEALEGHPVEVISVLMDDLWEFWDTDINKNPGK